MTGKLEETVRVQVEHKKLLVEKMKKTGESKEEVEKLTKEISQMMDLLRQYEDKNRKDDLPFDLPKRHN